MLRLSLLLICTIDYSVVTAVERRIVAVGQNKRYWMFSPSLVTLTDSLCVFLQRQAM